MWRSEVFIAVRSCGKKLYRCQLFLAYSAVQRRGLEKAVMLPARFLTLNFYKFWIMGKGAPMFFSVELVVLSSLFFFGGWFTPCRLGWADCRLDCSVEFNKKLLRHVELLGIIENVSVTDRYAILSVSINPNPSCLKAYSMANLFHTRQDPEQKDSEKNIFW